ncbi:hypothetical protein L9F63_018476, partial [Diploptera punctata]
IRVELTRVLRADWLLACREVCCHTPEVLYNLQVRRPPWTNSGPTILIFIHLIAFLHLSQTDGSQEFFHGTKDMKKPQHRGSNVGCNIPNDCDTYRGLYRTYTDELAIIRWWPSQLDPPVVEYYRINVTFREIAAVIGRPNNNRMRAQLAEASRIAHFNFGLIHCSMLFILDILAPSDYIYFSTYCNLLRKICTTCITYYVSHKLIFLLRKNRHHDINLKQTTQDEITKLTLEREQKSWSPVTSLETFFGSIPSIFTTRGSKRRNLKDDITT